MTAKQLDHDRPDWLDRLHLLLQTIFGFIFIVMIFFVNIVTGIVEKSIPWKEVLEQAQIDLLLWTITAATVYGLCSLLRWIAWGAAGE